LLSSHQLDCIITLLSDPLLTMRFTLSAFLALSMNLAVHAESPHAINLNDLLVRYAMMNNFSVSHVIITGEVVHGCHQS
jgi:hypothetical protein